ncbi:MAG TPA: GH39 family glycosyl hydrolase [Candidatus Wunengus sp. YC61]|uniref:GH39 family glycosyl hydrolase n=1 Tax=Candidatus Wunengus sp. YC61 TaxID=3367698 RepID=UPI00402697E4
MPPGRVITPQEISDTVKEVRSNPTSGETFEKRLKVVDALIMLSIRSGKANEVAKIAPPDTIPGIYDLKNAGKNDEAYKKLDSLYAELEKTGLLQIPEDVSPPKIIEPAKPPNTDVTNMPSPEHVRQEQAKDIAKSPKTKQVKEVVVDFSITEGEISPYVFGTTLGPSCDEKEEALLKEAGFKLLGLILPSNEIETSFYTLDDFKKDLAIITDIGATPLFASALNAKPRDEKQYFAQLKKIVTYINDEWAKKYPNGEWIFRFGNEPELPFFWRGSQEDFFAMYAKWAKIIKEINPKFIVGGPGFQYGCVHEGAVGSIIDYSKISPWVTNFLQYLERKKVPLDFLSSHAYTPHIYMAFTRQTRSLYSELTKHMKISHLFGTPKLGNDEWNIIIGQPWSGMYNPIFDQAWTAAHNISALINMIHEGLWLSTRYGGVCRVKLDKQKTTPPMEGMPPPPGAPPSFGGQLPLGIPPQQGVTDKGTEDFLMVTKDSLPKPVYYAFKGINQLANTPIKLKVTGNDGINFAVIAGKSADNNRVTIVLVNYDSAQSQKVLKGPPVAEEEHRHILGKLSLREFDTFEGYKLLFKHVPWSSKDKVVMKRYVVSDKDNLREVENKTLTNVEGKVELLGDIISPSIHIITYEKQM